MEDAFRALRRHAVGSGTEASALRAASGVAKALLAAEGAALLAEIAAATGAVAATADDASSEASGAAPASHGLRSPLMVGASSPSHGVARSPLMAAGAASPSNGLQPSPLMMPSAGSPSGVPLLDADCEQITEFCTWGQSRDFQLGFGATGNEQPVPRLLTFPQQAKVKMVSCGHLHTTAVMTCGSVYCWGFGGTTGRLGVALPADSGTSGPRCLVEPTALPEFGPSRHVAVKAAAGGSHSLVLTAAGKVVTWGLNNKGQTGVPGAPTSEGSVVARPTTLKTAFKNEEVKDVAAGFEHSLCVAGRTGSVYSWGSGARGQLGLGPPPAGPQEVSQPQQLPHLKGALSVAAPASGHVSVVLASHGDAVIFGGSAGVTAPQGGAAGCSAPDPKFFMPSRVRRKDGAGGRGRASSGTIGGADAEEEEWQTCRGGGGANMAPLRCVVFTAEEVLAVDSIGTLWALPVQGPRPCFAEVQDVVSVSASPKSSPQLAPQCSALAEERAPGFGFASLAVAEKVKTIWAVDRSASSCLWRLRRPAGSDRSWYAERHEQLAQVVFIACGPQHHSACIAYRRPYELLPPTLKSQLAEDSGDEGEALPPELLTQPLDEGGRQGQVPSLQQLCEDRLCGTLAPQNFGTVCEVAWDLQRPHLLDRAFAFLRANAALMFSKSYLPALTQLPLEVLAAFELSCRGDLPAPSAALDLEQPEARDVVYTLMASDWESAPELDDAGFTLPDAAGATGASTEEASKGGQKKSRKKRQAPDGGSPKAVVPGLEEASGKNGAAGTIPGPIPGSSPQSSSSAALWTKVVRGPRAKQLPSCSSGLLGAPQALSRPAPRPSATNGGVSGGYIPGWSTPTLPPSSAPPAAAQNWGRQRCQTAPANENPPLAGRQRCQTAPAGAQWGSSRASAQADATRNSWGFDCMPSERPKGPSVYQVQEEEQKEKARLKEDAEIAEIEAMFEALAIAEQEEERELLGLPSAGAASSSSAGAKPAKERAKGASKAKPKSSSAAAERKAAQKRGSGAADAAEKEDGRANGRSATGRGGGGRGKGGGKGKGGNRGAGGKGSQGRDRDRGGNWSSWWSWSSNGWSWDSWWSAEDGAEHDAAASGPTDGGDQSWEAARQEGGDAAVDGAAVADASGE